MHSYYGSPVRDIPGDDCPCTHYGVLSYSNSWEDYSPGTHGGEVLNVWWHPLPISIIRNRIGVVACGDVVPNKDTATDPTAATNETVTANNAILSNNGIVLYLYKRPNANTVPYFTPIYVDRALDGAARSPFDLHDPRLTYAGGTIVRDTQQPRLRAGHQ